MNVYFVKIKKKKGPIKIGVAKNVDQRVSDLQIACPWELKVLAILPCRSNRNAYHVEKQFHRKFKYAHIRGEWFECHIEDRIAKVLANEIEYIDKPSRTRKKDRYTEYK